MFAAMTKAVVRTLGAQGDLVPNGNANNKLEMLTLVKVRRSRFWPVVTFAITDQTLLDLLDDADVSPEHTEEVLTQDFKSCRGSCRGGRATASEVLLSLGEFQLSVDSVGEVSSFTLKKKTIDVRKLRQSCTDRKVRKTMVDLLRQKETEQLTFVYQTVSSSSPVTFHSRRQEDSSVSSACTSIWNFLLKSIKTMETSFTVPEGSTFAYGLMEVTTDNGTLGIPPRTTMVNQFNSGWWNLFSDGDPEDSNHTLQQVNREVEMKQRLLQPLEDLPESSRRDLLRALAELLEDRQSLTLLEQMLHQDGSDPSKPPPPQAVSSFMELLQASSASSSQRDAVHLLVSAVDTLPDDVPALLTRCPPDVLMLLNQLVDRLKEGTETRLPESPPPPLQEDGELRWAAELLCCSNEMLAELSKQWQQPELPPGVLLELLSLAVRGLSLMQPRSCS